MPSQEKINAMLNVLAKRWLSQGWRIQDPDDAKVMAEAWIEILDEYKIPYQQYPELYRRSVDLRVSRLNEGKDADDFSAEMMVSCWTTKGGLRDELKEADIKSGRYLTDAVAEGCEMCFGTGMWNPDGKGLRPGCPHKQED